MAIIRSSNEIILGLLDFLRTAQPELDTKAGTVARDLFVEAPASQLSLLYDELAKISNLQSLRLAIGTDLDRLAQNFGATRKTSSKSNGVALFTFSSIPATINIEKNGLVFASNGSSFAVVNGISVTTANSNLYRSIATKYRNDLDFLNITDQFAVEVTVQATTPGISGNLSKYSLVRTTIPGVSNVTNIFPFSNGKNQEDDATFRERVLAIFSGSNTGTSLGYKNTALADPNVLDVLVIEPGDPLMLRDGTQVKQNADGSFTIISEGTGGKVDIVILGTTLSEYIDTFIYKDKSNNNDPTDDKNVIVLGQIPGDENKTISRKRIDNIKSGVLPAQPVQDILEVTGSLSGSNFIPKEIDSLGRITGNYEILKDTGVYGGSVFGFDKLKWVSDNIKFEEDRIKGKFNGQDSVSFTDVINISNIQQNIQILNENSAVSSSDRSIIHLYHTPATNVTRVFNVNTGERYTIVDQSPDDDGSINTSGRIFIKATGTLPSTNDVLQVDYSWIASYDPYVDYDGRYLDNNPRAVQDSVDWGYSNFIRKEFIQFDEDVNNAFFTGTAKHPVTALIAANVFSQADGYVISISSGNFANRLAVYIPLLSDPIVNINSISLQNSNLEIFSTTENDGIIITERVVVGLEIKYNTTIILPTDTPAKINQKITLIYNTENVFNNVSSGNFSNNTITIPSGNIDTLLSSIILEVSYVANIQDLASIGIASFPISRIDNGFNTNSNIGFTNAVVSNILRTENQTVQENILNEFYVKLNCSSYDFTLSSDMVVSVIRYNDALELSNVDNPVVVSIDTDGKYLLTFNGFNSPAIGERVLILYYADDIRRFQPFTFNNTVISKSFSSLQMDNVVDKLYLPIYSFMSESSIEFSVIDPSTNEILATNTDGELTALTNSMSLSSILVDFSTVLDISMKKIKISNATNINNNGVFDIIAYDVGTNTLTITNVLDNIATNQISILRVLDGKELWSSDGVFDLENNNIYLPTNAIANENDAVVLLIFNSTNLRQAPTKISVNSIDQTNNSGIITLSGITMHKVEATFTAINNGLTQNIAEVIRKSLSLTSNSSIPSDIAIARIVKLEKVSTLGNEIISTDHIYDIAGSFINNNIFYANEMEDDDTLSVLEFTLPNTVENTTNMPRIGDQLNITLYYTKNDDEENLSFTRNGTLHTNKLFALINKIYISSGFSSTQSARFVISSMNQPSTGARYHVKYNYIAPKQNERIIVRYNYNKLIADTTLNIESSRPINADIIVRASKQVLVDVTMNIVIKPDFVTSEDIVLQNVKDRLTTAINTNTLKETLDSSDLITVAQAVDGVDRARVLFFNKNGNIGQVLSIIAQSDEYLSANNVVVNSEVR